MKKYIYEIRYFILIQIIFDGLFTLTNACIPYIQKILFDDLLLKSESIASFIELILFYALCITLGLLFSYFCTIYIWKGALSFEMSLKKDFFTSVFNYSYEEFSNKEIGEYISLQGNDITALEQDYLQPLIDIVKSINIIIIYGIILFIYVDWRIAATIFFTSIISILITNITSKKLSQKRNIYLKQMAEYVSKIKDLLEGFKLIQSNTKANIIKEHNKALKITTMKRYGYGKYKTFANSLSYFSLSCVSITAFILVGILLINKEITVGTAVATFGYITCFIAPIESVLYDINSINSLTNTKAKILASLRGIKKIPLKDKTLFESNIKLNDISFKYDNFHIDSLSFTFEKDKKYALIGASALENLQ